MKTWNVVSVSGGKDSTATLLLAIERQTENLLAVFADTGHEHGQTYEYVDYLERVTGVPIRRVRADFTDRIAGKRRYICNVAATKPKYQRDKTGRKRRIRGWTNKARRRALDVLYPTGIPFLDLCLWKGRFPSTKARFCTEELKRNTIIEQVFMPLLDQGDAVISWQGVRADESHARAQLPERDEVGGGLSNYRPILRWTAEDVFGYHRKHGIQWNPLYEQGMGRVGCMPCVNCRKDELQEIAARFPAEVERVAEWERLVSHVSKRGSATFFAAVNDPMVSSDDEIGYETHGISRMVEWSRTARGGRQFDLIASTGSADGCKSSYGLCEAPGW